MADDVVVQGKVLEWGNSFGIRVKKADLLEAGIGPGTEVILRLVPTPAKIDLSSFPFLRGGKPDDSVRHDELLAQAAIQDLEKARSADGPSPQGRTRGPTSAKRGREPATRGTRGERSAGR